MKGIGSRLLDSIVSYFMFIYGVLAWENVFWQVMHLKYTTWTKYYFVCCYMYIIFYDKGNINEVFIIHLLMKKYHNIDP